MQSEQAAAPASHHQNLSACLRVLRSAAAGDHQLAALHGMPAPLMAQSISLTHHPPDLALPVCALQLMAERRGHAIRDKQRRLQARASALMDLLRPPGHILSRAVMPRKLYRALTSSRRRRRRTRVGHHPLQTQITSRVCTEATPSALLVNGHGEPRRWRTYDHMTFTWGACGRHQAFLHESAPCNPVLLGGAVQPLTEAAACCVGCRRKRPW